MPRVTASPPSSPRRGKPRVTVDSPTQTLREPRALKDRPNRMRLALRRARRQARPVLLGGLALAGIMGAVLLLRATSRTENLTGARARLGSFGGSLGLRVRAVTIEGRNATPLPLLDAALGVHTGDPLLGFSVRAARARIETIASVEQATVERRWPGTVLVLLRERQAAAVWQHHGHFSLIDKNGAVLADQNIRHLAQGLTLLVGEQAPAHAANLLADLAKFPGLDARVRAAVLIGNRRWDLETDNGAYVLLPEDDEAKALRRLADLQASTDLLDRPLQVIDLRLPDRVTLRPEPGAKTPDPTGAPHT